MNLFVFYKSPIIDLLKEVFLGKKMIIHPIAFSLSRLACRGRYHPSQAVREFRKQTIAQSCLPYPRGSRYDKNNSFHGYEIQ